MLTFSVKSNTKKIEAILKRIQQSPNDEVRVGIFSEAVYPDGLPVATVAKWNDLGIVHPLSGNVIPPRPFITVGTGQIAKSKKFRKLYYTLLQDILKGKLTVLGAYRRLGENFSADLKTLIDQWSLPPNHPYTIELKGFDDPLVWTGRMRDSIDFKLAKRRKKQRVVKLRKKPTTRVR